MGFLLGDKLPFELGYRMPAEWEKHEGTWISWPKNSDSFPNEIIEEVEKTYIQMITELQKHEKVNLLIDDGISEKIVRELFQLNKMSTSNLILHKIHTSDVWFRDYGPIFVTKDGKVAFTHWKFNAWGNKYEDLVLDTDVPTRMPLSDFKGFDVPIVLEGGSIDVNGLGACLTTEQCLLNKNRNPQLSKDQIGKYLHDYLGATNLIWLKEGIAGDDTDGHVDDLARFVSKDTVVCAVEENKEDENYNALKSNLAILRKSKDQDGNKINVVPLPMPKPVIYEGQRLPASYTNFYIANETVLVPIFKDENDKKAIEILQKLFPDRKVIGINCRELVYGFGAIHCVTQQQPS